MQTNSPQVAQQGEKEKRSGLVIGAIVSLVVIAGIFWFALSGFPIRRNAENRSATTESSRAVIEEGDAGEMPEGTATIRDLEQPPPLVPLQVPPAATPTTSPTPAPVPIDTAIPPRAAANPPARVTPTPSVSPDIALQQRGEISEARALDRLTEFLRSTNFYKKPADCIALRSNGYRNVGYDLQAFSTCEGGSPELLDRWRVDAKTEEVFRRRSNGRYLAP